MTQAPLFPEPQRATDAHKHTINTHVPTRFIVTVDLGTPLAKRVRCESYNAAYYYVMSECHGSARITATDIGYIAILGDETW